MSNHSYASLNFTNLLNHSFFGVNSIVNHVPNLDDVLNQVLQESFQAPNTLSAALPDTGENAKRLEQINCKDDIPEEYLCVLSGAVMSHPVYDPKHPQIKFEKSGILRALETKLENPYTKTSLLQKDLVEDDVLKEKIDNFVETKISENQIKLSS